MNKYNLQTKWKALNIQRYPIAIIENGITKTIPAADFQKPPQEQIVSLCPSCYDAYKDLFRVIVAPLPLSETTVKQRTTLEISREKNKGKPLAGRKSKLSQKQKKIKQSSYLAKRSKNKGPKVMYTWKFENIKTKEVYNGITSVKEFCSEHNIKSWNNCYKYAADKKPFNGWNITKVEI